MIKIATKVPARVKIMARDTVFCSGFESEVKVVTSAVKKEVELLSGIVVFALIVFGLVVKGLVFDVRVVGS